MGPGRATRQLTAGRVELLRDEAITSSIQFAKVQCPVLRDETLERKRLLNWLAQRIESRVVLIVADAGYGKTTLLADYSRRTRLRTLWYRLDANDRDWRQFLLHLVAAGQQHDPKFGTSLPNLLLMSSDADSKKRAVEALLRDLADFTSARGAALVLDDFHAVDESDDCRAITQELIARAPEGVTFVLSSRQTPNIPLGRYRLNGDVAELTTDDLRFDLSETSSLFNDTYGRDLESDSLRFLASRTEGWIASLQLVQAALRDRDSSEVRRFIRSLNGADRELYDYLAEVVVGELPNGIQQFLMSTSILQAVTPELAHVVSGESPEEVARLTALAERLTLLGRVSGGPRHVQRYHPLVREFLEARLIGVEGVERVAELHRRVADAARSTNWRIAAHHYREAGDLTSMLRTLDLAMPTILANAEYSLAEGFLADIPVERRPAGTHLVIGRVDLQHGDYDAAERSARAVLDASAADAVQRDHALLNLLAVTFNYGDGEKSVQLASTLRDSTSDPNLRSIAEATLAIIEVATEHDLDVINRKLRSMAKEQRVSQSHHFGVSMYNLAANSLIQDRLRDAETEVEQALTAFAQTSSMVEREAASVLHVGILLRVGREEAATTLVRRLLSDGSLQNDVLLEAADAFDAFGTREMAEELLDRVGDRSTQTLADRRQAALTQTRLLLRRRKYPEAEAALAEYPDGLPTIVGMGASKLVLEGWVAHASGSPNAESLLRHAASQAATEGIHSARRLAELLLATTEPSTLRSMLLVIGQSSPWHLTECAESIIPLLDALDADARRVVTRAAKLHPNRWRRDLRIAIDQPYGHLIEAARLLDEIGEIQDVRRLRAFAKSQKRTKAAAGVGRTLARRLAPRVYVEDQGRVVITVGSRDVPGTSIRRKVLALLCFLLSRPEASATRDQVLEALWPELDPVVGANSLNQTLYFLRRVFEENYAEDLSPGYVHYDNDVIWLDNELVSSRTAECRRLMRSMPVVPSPDDVARLSRLYRGRFALDFEYEDWAPGFRDSLHATYLEIVERAVSDDVATGHHDRAIAIARRALDADPHADTIEVSLLRLYKATGAHSAAAEQYEHYAAVMREDLGVDPPTLESL